MNDYAFPGLPLTLPGVPASCPWLGLQACSFICLHTAIDSADNPDD